MTTRKFLTVSLSCMARVALQSASEEKERRDELLASLFYTYCVWCFFYFKGIQYIQCIYPKTDRECTHRFLVHVQFKIFGASSRCRLLHSVVIWVSTAAIASPWPFTSAGVLHSADNDCDIRAVTCDVVQSRAGKLMAAFGTNLDHNWRSYRLRLRPILQLVHLSNRCIKRLG